MNVVGFKPLYVKKSFLLFALSMIDDLWSKMHFFDTVYPNRINKNEMGIVAAAIYMEYVLSNSTSFLTIYKLAAYPNA